MARLQKKYTADYLTKKQKVNQGEVQMYMVFDSHPAIIDPEIWDMAQEEMKRRKTIGRWASSAHSFSGKILCGDCNHLYGQKTWHSTDAYKKTIWRCNDKYNGDKKCSTPHITDEQLKRAFVTAFNMRFDCKDEILAAYDAVLLTLTDITDLDAEAAELMGERDAAKELVEKLVKENATAPLDQADYDRRYNALVDRYENAEVRLGEIAEEKQSRSVKWASITAFLKALKKQDDIIAEFDEELCYTTAVSMIVFADWQLAVNFKDDNSVTLTPEQWK